MFPEVIAALESIKAISNITKAMLNIKNSTEITAKVIELNSAVLDVQQRFLEIQVEQQNQLEKNKQLIQENYDLKRQLENEQRFDRYYMQKIEYSGDVIFTLKDDFVTPEEPQHDICPQCKEQGRVSYLMKSESQYNCKVQGCGFKTYHSLVKPIGRRSIGF